MFWNFIPHPRYHSFFILFLIGNVVQKHRMKNHNGFTIKLLGKSFQEEIKVNVCKNFSMDTMLVIQ